MKFGIVPLNVAEFHIVPSVVYSQPVTMVSLSVNVVFRSNGLSTKLPNCVFIAVTVPGVGAVASER